MIVDPAAEVEAQRLELYTGFSNNLTGLEQLDEQLQLVQERIAGGHAVYSDYLTLLVIVQTVNRISTEVERLGAALLELHALDRSLDQGVS
jgi:hypothetical protein